MATSAPESAKEINDKLKTDFKRLKPDANPFLAQSWLGSLFAAISYRMHEYYLYVVNAILTTVFITTASDENVEKIAAEYGLSRNVATSAAGNVVATGTPGTVIPISDFEDSAGQTYTSTATVTILSNVANITSLTRIGTTVTAVTDAPHGLANNISVTIAGAVEPEYNTVAEITVTGESKFTYEITGAPASPATGTITASYDSVQVPVISNGFGTATNQTNGAELSFQSTIIGVETIVAVDYAEIGGGTDEESTTDLRIRTQERKQNPVSNFNNAAIVNQCKLVPGVTRVFVYDATPSRGQVTIYFMRDNDADPIPSAGEVATTKAKLLEIKPANTHDDDVIVNAPSQILVDFSFLDLVPNTPTMQASISANLRQFFDDNTSVGVSINEDSYRAAIKTTVDTETGATVDSFVLSGPSGDITINAGEIGTLGDIAYP